MSGSTDQHVYIIAEMAYSHDGSIDLAKEIVDGAADAKADAISIHITHMPDYMVRHYLTGPGRVSAGKEERPIYDYLVDITPSFETWNAVVAHARGRGLDIVIMPNDAASLAHAATLDPDAYVLSAASFEEYDFIRAVGKQGKPVYLRIGGSLLGEIETVVGLLREEGCEAITLLFGHQNYPTAVENTDLGILPVLRQTFGLPVGIADHMDADDDFAGIAPLLAIPLGVSCIEKHVTHDRSKRGEDFESALDPAELALFVTRVRKAEKALGPRTLANFGKQAVAYRKNARKRLVATRAIKAGESITAEMVAAKRSDAGVSAAHKDLVVGSVARKDIDMDEGIEFASFGAAN